MLSLDQDPGAYDRALLAAVHRALKPGAPFVLTTLNGYAASIIHYLDEQWDVPGRKRRMIYKERLYIPPALVRILESAGSAVDHV